MPTSCPTKKTDALLLHCSLASLPACPTDAHPCPGGAIRRGSTPAPPVAPGTRSSSCPPDSSCAR